MENQSDLRYLNIKARLNKLPSAKIKAFLDYNRAIVYDEINYDDGAYCPLAIMLGIEDILKVRGLEPNQEIVLDVLKEHEAFGTVKGIPGNFYRDNREADIRWLCQQILLERKDKF